MKRSKNWFKSGLVLAAASALVLALTLPVSANEAIAQAEGGITCTVCHDKPGSKLFTDKGKFYESTRSLEGYEEVLAAFKACTTCHVKKPGSKKLTQQGKAFERGVGGMAALREWALSAHPTTQEKAEGESPGDGVPPPPPPPPPLGMMPSH